MNLFRSQSGTSFRTPRRFARKTCGRQAALECGASAPLFHWPARFIWETIHWRRPLPSRLNRRKEICLTPNPKRRRILGFNRESLILKLAHAFAGHFSRPDARMGERHLGGGPLARRCHQERRARARPPRAGSHTARRHGSYFGRTRPQWRRRPRGPRVDAAAQSRAGGCGGPGGRCPRVFPAHSAGAGPRASRVGNGRLVWHWIKPSAGRPLEKPH